MAYIDWWNRTGPVTLGERFGLNEISIARNTLSPTKSYTEGGRIGLKGGTYKGIPYTDAEAEAIYGKHIEKLYKNKKVMIKGCTSAPVPTWTYLIITAHLANYAEKIYYGESCSAVKIFNKKNLK